MPLSTSNENPFLILGSIGWFIIDVAHFRQTICVQMRCHGHKSLMPVFLQVFRHYTWTYASLRLRYFTLKMN